MPKFYLRLEGVNIGNLVADTKDLSTIRGGGLLLLNSIKDVQTKFPQLQPISTGASSGLFELEAADEAAAKGVLRDISQFLNDDSKYRHATFVLNVLSAGSEESFARDKEKLIALNRWQQMRAPFVAIPAQNADALIEPCSENKLRPAKEKGGDKVSPSVTARRDYGLEQKQFFYERQCGRPIVSNQNQPRGFTHDFAGLANFSDEEKGAINPNLNGKLAVLYFDGNKFGSIQNERCETAAAQRNFDENLQGIRRQLLSDLIDYMEGHDHWLTGGNRYRLETLLWGGDEIIWVVPAWQGWRTIEFFYQQAQRKDWKFVDATRNEAVKLTHSAALVFCHQKAPIHRVRELAIALADAVKEQTTPNGNCFAYEILESFDHIGRDLEEYRRERVPASLRDAVGAKALILDGEALFNTGPESVIEIVSGLKEELPRRRLANIVKALLKVGGEAEDRKQIKELLMEMRQSRDNLEQLGARFRAPATGEAEADQMLWLHLQALWDYLAIA